MPVRLGLCATDQLPSLESIWESTFYLDMNAEVSQAFDTGQLSRTEIIRAFDRGSLQDSLLVIEPHFPGLTPDLEHINRDLCDMCMSAGFQRVLLYIHQLLSTKGLLQRSDMAIKRMWRSDLRLSPLIVWWPQSCLWIYAAGTAMTKTTHSCRTVTGTEVCLNLKFSRNMKPCVLLSNCKHSLVVAVSRRSETFSKAVTGKTGKHGWKNK